VTSLADDDYELLPHKEIEQLRAEVERLKRNPLGDGGTQQSLMDAIAALNMNLGRLTGILQSTNDEMLKAYHDTSVQEELRKVRAENAKIAHGIVAVAQLVKELEDRLGQALPRIEDVRREPVQLHADDLAADLTRTPNPFADSQPPARGAPEMDVPPPPPAFR